MSEHGRWATGKTRGRAQGVNKHCARNGILIASKFTVAKRLHHNNSYVIRTATSSNNHRSSRVDSKNKKKLRKSSLYEKLKNELSVTFFLAQKVEHIFYIL
jgi:hypothetical protein